MKKHTSKSGASNPLYYLPSNTPCCVSIPGLPFWIARLAQIHLKKMIHGTTVMQLAVPLLLMTPWMFNSCDSSSKGSSMVSKLWKSLQRSRVIKYECECCNEYALFRLYFDGISKLRYLMHCVYLLIRTRSWSGCFVEDCRPPEGNSIGYRQWSGVAEWLVFTALISERRIYILVRAGMYVCVSRNELLSLEGPLLRNLMHLMWWMRVVKNWRGYLSRSTQDVENQALCLKIWMIWIGDGAFLRLKWSELEAESTVMQQFYHAHACMYPSRSGSWWCVWSGDCLPLTGRPRCIV